jgi:RNase P subunit RPR2
MRRDATLSPPAPFRCRHCGAVLGLSRPDALEVGSVRLCRLVTVECVACGHATRWAPLPSSSRDTSPAR